MVYDIAAIQYLYGANMTYNSTNTTYDLVMDIGTVGNVSAFWDAGGEDTICD